MKSVGSAADRGPGREYDGADSQDRDTGVHRTFGEVRDMAQQRGEQGRGGLLIRGSDGRLFFMRDDAEAPIRLEEDLAERVNALLERQPPREISGLSPDLQKLLSDEFDIPWPSGIVVWWATRLPR